jgi:hypothetical protein
MTYVANTFDRSETPRRSEEEQYAFFEAVMARAIDADARARTGEFFLSLAGARIRMLFASASLQRDFLPALAHLQTSAVPRPDATFHVWTSAETGIEMIAPPCARNCFTDRGDIWGFDSARVRSAFHWSECSLSLMDMDSGLGTFWVDTPENLPYWSKASPLRTLLHWLMAQRGCQLIHAAAIGNDDGGVLISGKGGVGKSTTALACLAAGMKYLADDYLVVKLDPQPTAFSLYSTAKIAVPQLQHFPELRDLLAGPETPENDKAVLNLWQSEKYRVTSSLPLVAALTPRFVPQSATAVSPAPSALLRHAAAFTTMTQLPHAGRATYEFIQGLTERLPCYEILLGRDIDSIPSALTTFLARPEAAVVPTCEPVTNDARSAYPFATVIIPVYNGAHFLRGAIDSVLAQNYSPLEIIVVDDGSSDNLKGAVRELNADVRFFEQRNSGPAAARNLGIRNATGEFFAFLDVDDLWPQDTLSTLADRLIEQPELDVVYGYGQLMRSDESGKAPEFIGNARESFPYYIGSALYRRRAFDQVGLFDEGLLFDEDTDWFGRARETGLGIERLDRITLLVRRHDGNMTKNSRLRELGALRVFKKALDRSRGSEPKR